MKVHATHLATLGLCAALSGCVTTPVQQPTETDGGIIETTNEMSIAETGFPLAAVIMTRSVKLDDGLTMRAVQYDSALATQAMINAAPAALCAAFDLTLVSSKSFAPTPDYLEMPDTAVTEAICK
jgi:hypothetical protein